MSLTEFNAEKVYRDWLAEGREEGFEQGREEGREQGRAEGLEEGREQGRAEGREKGRAEGRELGISEGKDEKAREDAIGLYENGVSVEIIAKSLKLSEEKVREIIKQNVTVKA